MLRRGLDHKMSSSIATRNREEEQEDAVPACGLFDLERCAVVPKQGSYLVRRGTLHRYHS